VEIFFEGDRIVSISPIAFVIVAQLKKQIEFLSNKGALNCVD